MARARERPKRSRSPVVGTCGTTWARRSSGPSTATTLASANHRGRPARRRALGRCGADGAGTFGGSHPGAIRRDSRAAGRRMFDPGISRELGLERGTVHRYARGTSLDELLAKTRSRETVLDGFEPCLRRRWNEGCTNATRLFAEIQADGYRCSVLTVRRYLHTFRATGSAPDQAQTQLKVREVVGSIMRA